MSLHNHFPTLSQDFFSKISFVATLNVKTTLNVKSVYTKGRFIHLG